MNYLTNLLDLVGIFSVVVLISMIWAFLDSNDKKEKVLKDDSYEENGTVKEIGPS